MNNFLARTVRKSMTCVLQFHDQRDIFLFCCKQPVVFKNAGTFPLPCFLEVHLAFASTTITNAQSDVCTGMVVHRHLLKRLRHGALLRHFNVRSPRKMLRSIFIFLFFITIRASSRSLMFIFGINKCRLFAFFFFGWKLNAVVK